MLDDLKYISQLDNDDALGVVGYQFEQLLYRFSEVDISHDTPITRVVVAGMGGSALAANFVQTWPGLIVPFEVIRDYALPAWVDEYTLVIASSYSGNTEETVDAVTQAKTLGAQIAIVAAGGKLAELAQANQYPFAKLPGGLQPRMAPFYNFKALLTILEGYGLINGCLDAIEATARKMQNTTKSWQADVPTAKNQAKQLAELCAGKTPIIYAGPKLYPAAYKWKINFNENSKNTAWCNQLPEFNHNELLGWTSHPIEKPFAIIDLISSFEHPQVLKRFEMTDRLLSGQRPKAIEVYAQGDTLLEQLLWVIALGDMTSLYLAFLNGLNPSPVDLMDKFKKALI